MTFDLRELALRIIADSATPDPSIIAKDVCSHIKDVDLRHALDQMMRPYVRELMHHNRGGNGDTTSALTPGRKPLPSAKVAAIRAVPQEEWTRRLREPVHVGSSQWKFFSECTTTDFFYARDERLALAETNTRASRHYARAGQLLLDNDVDTWSKLPVEVQRSFLDKPSATA